MSEASKILLAIGVLIFCIVCLILLIVIKNKRVHYIGDIHVVVDGYDSEHYMFLVIEKGKEVYIQDGKYVKLRIVEDIPERGRDTI